MQQELLNIWDKICVILYPCRCSNDLSLLILLLSCFNSSRQLSTTYATAKKINSIPAKSSTATVYEIMFFFFFCDRCVSAFTAWFA